MEHMVYPFKFACFLVCCHISGIFHHHDHGMVSPGIAADRTKLLIRQCLAAFAVAYVRSCPGHGRGQLLHLFLGHVNDMKSQSLGRFLPDPRQPGKLLDELTDRV